MQAAADRRRKKSRQHADAEAAEAEAEALGGHGPSVDGLAPAAARRQRRASFVLNGMDEGDAAVVVNAAAPGAVSQKVRASLQWQQCACAVICTSQCNFPTILWPQRLLCAVHAIPNLNEALPH